MSSGRIWARWTLTRVVLPLGFAAYMLKYHTGENKEFHEMLRKKDPARVDQAHEHNRVFLEKLLGPLREEAEREALERIESKSSSSSSSSSSS